MADNAQVPNDVPAAEETPTPPPKRSPGHRGTDVRDAVAEMTARAHEISLEAGSKMAAAMKDVINAAAGLAGFAIESARDLVQYMVRRGQMTQDEADKLLRDAEEAHARRKALEPATAAAPAARSEPRPKTAPAPEPAPRAAARPPERDEVPPPRAARPAEKSPARSAAKAPAAKSPAKKASAAAPSAAKGEKSAGKASGKGGGKSAAKAPAKKAAAKKR